jgi:hypothetical protein
MPMSSPSLQEGLADSDRVIGILEQAQRELSFVLRFDEGIRVNPQRRVQFDSIAARLNFERRKRALILRRLEGGRHQASA